MWRLNKAFYPLVFLAIWGAAGLRAAVVFEQPVFNVNDRGPFSEFGGQQIADQFTLGSSTTVFAVNWYGSYHSVELGAGVTNVDFVIRFYDDVAGLPALTPFYSANVSATVTDSGVVFEEMKIYSFSGDPLPTPVSISGGQTTWISILESDATTASSGFRWANSTVALSDTAAVRFGEGAAWSQITGDRANSAFALLDASAIPEPSTVILLTVGLALFGWRRRAAAR